MTELTSAGNHRPLRTVVSHLQAQLPRPGPNDGRAASTQAGAFVREEIEAIRKGEHGARSTKQAIAIGLSKARRAGVKLPAPAKGKAPEETRQKAKRDLEKAENGSAKRPSQKRARATLKALKFIQHRCASGATCSATCLSISSQHAEPATVARFEGQHTNLPSITLTNINGYWPHLTETSLSLTTPLLRKHINPFGKYHFDLERMRQTADPSPGETALSP